MRELKQELFLETCNKFQSLMEPYWLIEVIGSTEEIPNGLFCMFEPHLIARDWSGGMESPIECGMSQTKYADMVAMMLKNKDEQLTISEAELRVQRLVYSKLNESGFSVDWNGTVFGGIYLQPEDRFYTEGGHCEKSDEKE